LKINLIFSTTSRHELDQVISFSLKMKKLMKNEKNLKKFEKIITETDLVKLFTYPLIGQTL